MKEDFNPKLWSKEITKQLKEGIGALWSDEPVILEQDISKHKYFAFRVDKVKEIQSDPEELSNYAYQAVIGLNSAMINDLASLIRDAFFNDDTNVIDSIKDTLKNIGNLTVSPISEVRVQCAYDLDYLSLSVVGDIQYKIGFKK